MAHISPEVKEEIVLKAIDRGSKSLRLIAQEYSVGYSSLLKWLRNYRDGIPLQTRSKGGSATTCELTPVEQFDHILATHTLDECIIGAVLPTTWALQSPINAMARIIYENSTIEQGSKITR
jgi:transposase-like protein